jgi:hypothetical protein
LRPVAVKRKGKGVEVQLEKKKKLTGMDRDGQDEKT